MISSTQHPESERKASRKGNGKDAIIKEKPIYYENQRLKAIVYDRSRLHPGDRFNGPAVVVEYSSTTFVPPASSAHVDEYANLLIDC
jgi:N-methylhydantoinase A